MTVSMTIRRWTSKSRNYWTGYLGGGILVVFLVAAIFAPQFATHEPNKVDLDASLRTPGVSSLLGTDQLGRDVFSRVVHGTRSTMGIAIPVAISVTLLGLVVGLAAGYFGGWTDTIISTLLNALFALPGLVLSLAILALLGSGPIGLLVALTASGWASFARVVRGPTLVVRETEYVVAARAVGASDFHILRRHVCPNILGPVLVLATLDLGTVVLSISALSFLGLGNQPPTAEWGTMLNDGRPYFRSHPHLMFTPGVAIFLLVLGTNLLGDTLRDAFDPRRP